MGMFGHGGLPPGTTPADSKVASGPRGRPGADARGWGSRPPATGSRPPAGSAGPGETSVAGAAPGSRTRPASVPEETGRRRGGRGRLGWGQGPRPGVGAAPSGSRRRVWAGAFHGHRAFRVWPTPWKALHERGQCLGDQPPPRATRLTWRGGGPAAGHTAGRWPSRIRTQAARLGPGRCGEARGSGRSLAPGGGGGSSAPCSRRSSDSAAPLAWRGVQAWH